MKTYEVLEKALALIEDEENWCQLMPEGGWTGPGRCAVVAICDVEGTCVPALESLARILGDRYKSRLIPEFNDTHSHAEVVALFQQAIRVEKRKEGISVDIPEPVEVTA